MDNASLVRLFNDIPDRLSIAVLVPCYNEAATIANVVTDFQKFLPSAVIYVYDNNSHDGTSEVARASGAVVRYESLRGKGNVVRRMFADIEADVYVLVDGDATYDAASAPKMVCKLLEDGLDMLTSNRISIDQKAYRPGHRFGNKLLTKLVSTVFGTQIVDMLSGYRVFSRRYVKSFPATAKGFETETELTVHALELRMRIAELEAPYFPRPDGSESKLSTYRDGLRILWMIGRLIREERPLQFFASVALMLLLPGVMLGSSILIEFVETGLVPRLPTAVLSTGLVLLSFLSLYSGIVLNSVSVSRREARRLAYLQLKGPILANIYRKPKNRIRINSRPKLAEIAAGTHSHVLET
ncbi:glycosyltransferase family 2 protein [Microvirga tunisiensis]|uniref:Glycosyltransferase n=1 Tax=Microvirga tunisiensis TaxID=2108360 RepID=A0A5N7MU92_9HYPH|nr:glycosyltransferase family 2 protein [Microvirga tunisiensis]MPR12315.1 glycosyltransferase [Microvirga tunisiensis]MPR30240.1 glycosyltransferase [Microvirga tunisiensis]